MTLRVIRRLRPPLDIGDELVRDREALARIASRTAIKVWPFLAPDEDFGNRALLALIGDQHARDAVAIGLAELPAERTMPAQLPPLRATVGA